MLLAWCSLLPIFIMVGFVTLILFRRDLHTVSPRTTLHQIFLNKINFAIVNSSLIAYAIKLLI